MVTANDRDRVLRRVRPNAETATRRLRLELGDESIIRWDPLTGTPSMLGRTDGFLTGRSAAPARSLALSYIRQHATTLGLSTADLATFKLRRDYVDIAGTHHLSWIQDSRGVSVFGNGLRVDVTRRGELIAVHGAPVPQLTTSTSRLETQPAISAVAARADAAADVGGRVAVSRQLSSGRSVRWANRDRATLTWFITARGPRLAWSTYVQAGPGLSFQHVIDARTGAVLYRHDLVASDRADARVYENHPGAARGGQPMTVNLVRRGFLPRASTTLQGKTVFAWSDVNDDNELNAGESVPVTPAGQQPKKLVPFPSASERCSTTYVCTWDPNRARSWQTNREVSATEGFYLASQFHDYLEAAPFGFTPAAGNFETNGGDPVLLQDLDGANTAAGLPDLYHVNNANMGTPPDGIPPTMQMYLWHQPGATDDQDRYLPTSSSFDPSILFHEYTHGLSYRLVVDAAGNSTLHSLQAGSMGEAWSDYYAMDNLVTRGLVPDSRRPGEVREGEYVVAGENFRTMPIDCPVRNASTACTDRFGRPGGYTYGDVTDVAGYPEVHASGEIWAQTLWDLRRRFGHRITGMLVTRAMELSPADPSFLDMRNAILQADLVVYGGRHRSGLWRTFANRGMGWSAGTQGTGDATPVEDFSLPPTPSTPRATLTGHVTDLDSGRPAVGVRVAISGHDSGFGPNWVATTDAGGSYTIPDVYIGRYPVVTATGSGYLPMERAVTVQRGTTVADFEVRRDWAALAGGASVADFNGSDYSAYGCGPVGAIDLSLSMGWGSDAGDGSPTGTFTPKYVVIALPAAVTVKEFAVDPAATCGDGASASTGAYRIETSPDRTSWTTVSEGSFTPGDRGRLNSIPVTPVAGVRYVRFTIMSNQVPDFATNCPAVPYAGCTFADVTEIAAFGAPTSSGETGRGRNSG